jgi:hypothetical protein
MKFIHMHGCREDERCRCVYAFGYRVKEVLKPGDLVALYDDFKVKRAGEVVMLPGMVAKLESFSNDGFNGISAAITINGQRVAGVAAGQLRKADDGTAARTAIQAEYARRLKAVEAAARHLQDWADAHNLEVKL